jgi:hypothetical protein
LLLLFYTAILKNNKMEVHSHAHSERKKWTHYLWEFFMLFLAVFCGFLAENQREHYAEHKREIQYIRSYIEDLHTDIKTLSFQAPLFEEKVKKIDTLVECLKHVSPATGSNRSYLYFWHASWFYKFFPIDRTMQQLKNAGNMRLIQNKIAADSILYYDRETKFIQIHIETSLYKNGRDLQDVENKLFDFSLIPGWGLGKNRNSLSYPENANLLTYDPTLIKEYINKLINAQRDYSSHINYLSALKARGERLIQLLQKEYHLSEGTPLEK